MDAATHNNGAPPPQNTLSSARSTDAVANPWWLLPPEQAPQPPCDGGQRLLPYGRPVPCLWHLQMEDERRRVAKTTAPAMTFAQLMELATATATTAASIKAAMMVNATPLPASC